MPLRPGFDIGVLERRGQGFLPGLIGVRVESLAEGALTMSLDVRPQLLAPNGFLHAATVIGLADTACGYACIAHLPDGGTNFTTIELKSNFLGTARDGTIVAVATAAHLGSTTQVWDAVVSHRQSGKRIALFRCTQMILKQR
jgi:uncharacterized protein (TIGR00369 family)